MINQISIKLNLPDPFLLDFLYFDNLFLYHYISHLIVVHQFVVDASYHFEFESFYIL